MKKQILSLKDSISPVWRSKFKYTWNKFKPQLTYAQDNEDLVILELFGNINKFIDIGANDGITCSNTFLFSLRGAEGLMFEPTSAMFSLLVSLYSLNSLVVCINEGLSNKEHKISIKSDGLLSYIPETQDKKLKELLSKHYSENSTFEQISVKPLNYWLQHYLNFRQCDFVSLDVEGHELSVLQGIDFTRFQTKCFIVETHARGNLVNWLHRDYEAIDQLLSQNGYRAVLRNRINTFWLHDSGLNSEKLQEVCNKFSSYELMPSI